MPSSSSLLSTRLLSWMTDQVSSGKLPTAEVLVWRKGQRLCHERVIGLGPDCPIPLYRMYSMTKSIVSVGLMQLVEEGRIRLNDPVFLFLGSGWKRSNMIVVDAGKTDELGKLVTKMCERNITVHMLLTHTSGLSHGIPFPGMDNRVDEFYTGHGLSATDVMFRVPKKDAENPVTDLQMFCERLAKAPLIAQPGEAWHYSYAVDLLGRIIEVVSGKNLEEFLQERVFLPLGMVDTSFILAKEKESRFSDCWEPRYSKGKMTLKSIGHRSIDRYRNPPFYNGSGGLISSAQDYGMFCEMLLHGGLSRAGKPILSSQTIEYMTKNHLRMGKNRTPARMQDMTVGQHGDLFPLGRGFGLGFSIVEDDALDYWICNKGEYGWSGAASTIYFVDPKEELFVVFCTQVLLADPRIMGLDAALHAIVYGALESSSKL